MGRTRTEPSDAIYQQRHDYYLQHREELLRYGKERYNELKAPLRRLLAQARLERLQEKSREIKHRKGLNPTDARVLAARMFIKQSKEGKPCKVCGVVYPHYVMDYDHVRGIKRGGLSDLAFKGRSITILRNEIKKCDLICANCHRERTFG